MAEVLLQAQALCGRRLHGGHEDLHPASATCLRRVHGQLRMADQLIGTCPVCRRDGDADAQADHQAARRELEGRLEHLAQAFRYVKGVTHLTDVLD